MNGFTERGTSESSGRTDGGDGLMTWGAASAMLPLVGRIAADIVELGQRLATLIPEKERLDRLRQDLRWPARARRYELEREISAAESELQNCRAELEALRVILLNPQEGLVGFPTIVNDHRAFFSWKPGEDGLTFWNYLGDTTRHPVPASWTKPVREARGRSRSSR